MITLNHAKKQGVLEISYLQKRPKLDNIETGEERKIKMTPGLRTRGILDPERCWKLWIELGSLNKVKDQFAIEGLINPITMKPPTISAIEKAAYRWALENQEEARQDLSYSWGRVGEPLTDERWHEFLVSSAELAYFVQPAKIKRFIEENELERVYESA